MERLIVGQGLRKKLTQSFYKFLLELFGGLENQTRPFYRIVEIAFNLFTFFQLSTLLWTENTLPSEQESMVNLLNALETIRLEVLSSKFGIILIWDYFVITGLILTVVFSLFLFFLVVSDKSRHCYFLTFVHLSMRLFTTILSIPTLTIILHIIYKYSSKNFSDPKYNFEVSAWLFTLNFLSLIFLLTLNTIWILFNYNTRHSQPRGKAYPSFEINSMLCNYLTVASHVFLLDNSPLFSYSLTFILHSFSSILYINFIPNYDKSENLIKAAFHSSYSIMVVLVLIGFKLTGGFFFAYGFITIIPAHIVIIKHLIDKKFKKLAEMSIEDIESIYEFELLIRNSLTKKDGDVLDMFSKAHKILNGKCEDIFYVWESYYCLDILQNERLAIVKLYKSNEKTAFGGFQTYKLLNDIGEFNINYTDLAHVQCLLEIGNINKLQKEFFDEFLNFMLIVPNNALDSKLINNHCSILNEQIHSLDKKYNNVISSFPEHFSQLVSYPDFVCRIVGNKSKSEFIQSQQQHLNSELSKSQKSQEFGVLIISADEQDLGTILYSNSIALQILDADEDSVLGSLITEYIPEPYRSKHTKYLGNYAKNCKSVFLDFPSAFFLLTHKKFLIEIYMSICICGMNDKHFYYFKFRRLIKDREIALLDSSGSILAHSELMSYYLNVPFQNLVNCYLPDIMRNLDFDELKREKYLIHQLKWIKVGLTYIELPFRSHFFYILILSKNLKPPFKKLKDATIEDCKLFEPFDDVCEFDDEEFCELSDEFGQAEVGKSVSFSDIKKIDKQDFDDFENEYEFLNLNQDQSEISMTLKRKSGFNLKNLVTSNLISGIKTGDYDTSFSKESKEKQGADFLLYEYKKYLRRFSYLNKIFVSLI